MLDPSPQEGLLPLGQGDGVVGENLFPEKRLLGTALTGDRGDARRAVEPQASLGIIWPVAADALAGENGADVLIEGYLAGKGCVVSPGILLLTTDEQEKGGEEQEGTGH